MNLRSRLDNLTTFTPDKISYARVHAQVPNNNSAQIHLDIKINLSKYLQQAGIKSSPMLFYLVSLGLGLSALFIALIFLPSILAIFISALAFYAPFAWLNRKIRLRVESFAEDYSTVLLATASSMKTGLTPIHALERSTKLLPKTSLIRHEIKTLVESLRQGKPRERALENFAASIALAELSLFRNAFLLVLENGGKFAPTLQRLALLAKDREELIANARVSTATMRMTANVLLAVAPLLLLIVSLRSENYTDLLLNHPTASFLAALGACIIGTSYLVLRSMSNFKP